MSETNLKPCPFCGENLKRCNVTRLLYQHPYKENGCFLRGYTVTSSDFNSWNTRKPMERIVEQLEDAKSYSVSPQFNKGIDMAIGIVQKGGAE